MLTLHEGLGGKSQSNLVRPEYGVYNGYKPILLFSASLKVPRAVENGSDNFFILYQTTWSLSFI